MDHRTTEKTAEDIAKLDHEQALSMKSFIDSLPTYVKDRTLGPVIPRSDMLSVSGCACRMQRTEVTQLQWMIVMGNNPSKFVGADRPVEQLSWDDLMMFIKKVGEMDGVHYRLPDESEWVTACLAGSKTKWGKRKNGVEGPFDAMGWSETKDSWRDGHRSVALKDPNAWGFYDMHGNVWEMCKITYPHTRRYYARFSENEVKFEIKHNPKSKLRMEFVGSLVCCGGSSFNNTGHPMSYDVEARKKVWEGNDPSAGFRLAESVK